jgi:hypothetical protein
MLCLPKTSSTSCDQAIFISRADRFETVFVRSFESRSGRSSEAARGGPDRAGGSRVTCLRSSRGPGRPAHRRAAAAGPAGGARIPRQLPVADRPDRVPRRCWHPGRCRPAPGHARGHRGGHQHRGQARARHGGAPACSPADCGCIGGGHRGRAGGRADHPPDTRSADRGPRCHRGEPYGRSGPARGGRDRPGPARSAAAWPARARPAPRRRAAGCRGRRCSWSSSPRARRHHGPTPRSTGK